MPARVSTVAPINPLLTNVAVGYTNLGFIAERVLPVVPVANEKFTYYKFGKDSFKRYNTKRSIGAKAMRLDYSLSTTTGTCEEYMVEHPIDDRIRAEAQKPLDPDVQGTEICTQSLLLDYEKRVADMLTTYTNYASGMYATPSTKWDAAGATIFDDITTGQEAVRQKIGQYPNVMVVPPVVAQKLAFASEVTDYIKNVIGLTRLERPQEGGWQLPEVLFGMRVVVPWAVEVTSNLQQAETTADIWGDYVLILYVEPRPAIMRPSFGYTFRRRNFQVRTYRDETIKSDIIETSFVQVEAVITTDDDGKYVAGYNLYNCIT